VDHVSWLEADDSPSRGGSPSGFSESTFRANAVLSQWRGRAGFAPASGWPRSFKC